MTIQMEDPVELQNEYVQQLAKSGFSFDLVVAGAFVRGMRDAGYRDSSKALNELIDNAAEAGADNILVEFGYELQNKTRKKPQLLAVVDDGAGMPPAMIRAAILWGGTHRALQQKKRFGKYGFGLPSAAVSQGCRFEVYSKIRGQGWFMSYIDTDEIENDRFYRDPETGRISAPPPVQVDLPDWVKDAIQRELKKPDLEHGTVVILRKLDQIKPKTTEGLERHLLQQIGVTYRNFLGGEFNVFVNKTKVKKVDPLFIDPNAQFYRENAILAEPLPAREAELKDPETDEFMGVVEIRSSYMPPGFQNVTGKPRGKTNARMIVMKENNGLLFLREGRQIEVVTRTPWDHHFQAYDRNCKIEINFPADLDADFGITTSKQQIVPSERLWAALDKAGVRKALRELKARYAKEAKEAKEQEDEPKQGESRVSAEVMSSKRKYRRRQAQPTPEEIERARKLIEQDVEERARETGEARETAKEKVEAKLKERPYSVAFRDMPQGPFYWVEPLIWQNRLVINTAHPFYTTVYRGPGSTARTRTALELLLFVMGEAEISATAEGREFYSTERMEWTREYATALRLYGELDPAGDAEEEEAESLEQETAGQAEQEEATTAG